jgi:hypothetical protein
MSFTNETLLTRVAGAADALGSMPKQELLANPTPGFVDEYNRTRQGFVQVNPKMADASPPEILDQCRYVELLAYYEQLRGLLWDLNNRE